MRGLRENPDTAVGGEPPGEGMPPGGWERGPTAGRQRCPTRDTVAGRSYPAAVSLRSRPDFGAAARAVRRRALT